MTATLAPWLYPIVTEFGIGMEMRGTDTLFPRLRAL